MCGFVGLFHRNKQLNRVHDFVEMTDSIRHRGPDDNGIVLFSFDRGNWREIDPSQPPESEVPFEGAIGCNRLKIIDLSENGHQPMIDPTGRYVLVPVDEPPELTEEQEAGLEAALASVVAGQGVSRDEAYAKAKANLE